jgi:hypothetical protein
MTSLPLKGQEVSEANCGDSNPPKTKTKKGSLIVKKLIMDNWKKVVTSFMDSPFVIDV